MKKRVISLLLVAAMTVGLVACGSNGSDSKKSDASSDEKILSVEVGPDPETVDPALNAAIDGGEMILHSFEGLLKLDKNGDPEAGQAESWEVSDDGLTYTFHLRDGLKWSDGSDLTAEDFVYSWQRVCDPNLAAPYAETVLGMVEGYDDAINGDIEKLGVEATDDSTFVVHLANPCPYFESLAAFATLNPVQKATVEKNGDAWATEADTYISNGPFYVAEWVPGSYILMKKNTNYWDADSVKLDGIKFNLIEDANAAYSAYQTGECQMIKDVPTEEIPSLKDSDEFYVEPIIGTYYLSLNLDKEPFNNKQVRQALSLAIDRDYVANTLMQGTYTPAGNLVGPGWKDTDGSDFSENANGGEEYISTTDYDANLQKAKDLLAEAGYADGKGIPKITYSTNDAGYHKVVAEYLQKAWGELGIDVDVEIVEWASFTPMRRNGDYMASRNGWVGDYSDPSNILELFTTSNGNNDGNYANADFDAVLEQSRNTTDTAERSKLLHEAEDMLMDDAACIPIAYYNDFYLMSSKVTGAWHASNGYWYFMYADLAD